jgi:hypothetical protein
MAQYKAVGYYKRTGKTVESCISDNPNVGLDSATIRKCKVVVVLRDSQGEDHPDNAGKFFLHRIVK